MCWEIVVRFAAPILVAIVTLPIGDALGRRRERQNHMDHLIAGVADEIWSCAERASEYWRMESTDREIGSYAVAIKIRETRIGTEIREICSKYSSFRPDVDDRLVEFRQAVMGDHFEERDRDPEPKRIERIRCAADRLVGELRSAQRRATKMWAIGSSRLRHPQGS